MSEAWTQQRFNDSLKQHQAYPLYYLYGDETFLVDEALDSLVQMILGDSIRDFNLNTFYGEDAAPDQVRDAIETFPMMAPMRVVVLKEAQELSDKQWEELALLIENPVETTAWICVGSKVDKRKKYIKRFLERGVVVEFKRPFENQIPDWIMAIGKKHGIKLNHESTQLIHQLVGNSLIDINAEIVKLTQYLGERKVAETEDVLAVVSRLRVDSVFDLADAIGHNDRARALFCLANLLDHGQNEVGVLALITRHLRILRLVRDGLSEGLSNQRLSSRAGVSPYFLKQYMEQVRDWSEEKIDGTFHALLETDRALKSSPVASHIWLENFIIQTCNA